MENALPDSSSIQNTARLRDPPGIPGWPGCANSTLRGATRIDKINETAKGEIDNRDLPLQI